MVSLYSLELEKQTTFDNDAEEIPRMKKKKKKPMRLTLKANAQWGHQLIPENYSEESWSELESLNSEIEGADYMKD